MFKPIRIFALLSSTALLPVVAMAQTSGNVPPPTRYVLDENGVNTANGAQWGVAKEASIGSGGGELAHLAGWGVSSDGTSFGLNVYNSGTTWSATIFGSAGRVSLTFSKSGSTFTSLGGDGATLVDTGSAYVLTLANGTIYTYGNRNQATSDGTTVKARITQIESPNHARVNMAYQQVTYCSNNLDACAGGVFITKIRLQGVTNTFGYQLHYNYQANSANTSQQGANWDKLTNVRALNMAVDACDSAAPTCSYTQNWAQTSYATTLSGNDTITTVTDPLSRAVRYTRGMDATGVYFKAKRPNSGSDNLTIRIDSAGRVTQLTRDGLTWQYAFTLSGSTMTSVRTNPNGTTRTIISDTTVGLPTSFTDELGKTTSYTYDASGRLTRATLPEGNYVQLSYDSRGNISEERHVSKTPGTPPDVVISAGYSASCANSVTCNKPDWTKDTKGNQTDYTWDTTHGGLLAVTAPTDPAGMRPQTRYGYSGVQAYFKNPAGSIVASGVTQYELASTSSCVSGTSCTGSANERKTTINYGPQVAGTANNLLPLSATAAAGDNSISAAVTLTYDSVGNRTAIDGPLPGSADTTVTRYDAAREVVGVVGPDPDGAGTRTPVATRLTYNADGQVTQQEVGTVTDQSDTAWANFTSAQQSVTSYDSSARPIKTETKTGGTTYAVAVQSFDAMSRPDCSAVRMDPAQWSAQTDACTPQTTGPNGPDRIAKPTYDNANRVTAVTSALGTADASTQTTSYTSNGQTASVKDGENNLTTYEYDGLDRLVKTRYPVPTQGANSSSTTDFDALAYDLGGNVTTRTQRDGSTITYAYDNLNRVSSRTPQGENVVNYSYNLLGQITSVQRPGDGLSLASSFDGLGRTISDTQPYGSAAFQVDLAGRMTRLTWSDGFYVTFDYDVTGNVTAIRENGAASGIGVLASYSYDSLGRRSAITRGNGTTTSYAFDPVSRLASLMQDLAGTTNDLTIGTFAYNSASQIVSQPRSNDAYAWTGAVNTNRNYTANGLNQYSASGAVSLSYDARGNLTASGTSTYGYDKLNELISGPNPAGGSALLTYDPAGRLSQITGTSGTIRFGYAGSAMIQESNSSGTLQRRYVPGPGTDEPLVWYEGNGTADRRWLHADERGSVIAISDGAGAMLAINRYDEYGIPQATNAGRFQYTGQAWLPELGMYHYKARIYSPTLGRFMQADPIGYGDGLNLYNYAGSDPVGGTDPAGLADYNKYDGPLTTVTAQKGNCPGGFFINGSLTCYNYGGVSSLFSQTSIGSGTVFSGSDNGGGSSVASVVGGKKVKCDSQDASVNLALTFVSTTADLTAIAAELIGVVNLEDGVGEGFVVAGGVSEVISKVATLGQIVYNVGRGNWPEVGSAGVNLFINLRGARALKNLWRSGGLTLKNWKANVTAFAVAEAIEASGGHCK